VEVSRRHGGNYRVNIWEQPEPDKHIAVTIGLTALAYTTNGNQGS
jgi:hypothetical protein